MKCARRLEEGIEALGVGVTEDHELPCRFRDSNPGLLERQPELLFTKPSLQDSSYQAKFDSEVDKDRE